MFLKILIALIIIPLINQLAIQLSPFLIDMDSTFYSLFNKDIKSISSFCFELFIEHRSSRISKYALYCLLLPMSLYRNVFIFMDAYRTSINFIILFICSIQFNE